MKYPLYSSDDPVTKFLPEISYYDGSWAKHLNLRDNTRKSKFGKPPITLRQLASHMAGFGRDYPPMFIKDYPHVNPSMSHMLERMRSGSLLSL